MEEHPYWANLVTQVAYQFGEVIDPWQAVAGELTVAGFCSRRSNKQSDCIWLLNEAIELLKHKDSEYQPMSEKPLAVRASYYLCWVAFALDNLYLEYMQCRMFVRTTAAALD